MSRIEDLIEEIRNNHYGPTSDQDYAEYDIERIMQQYAEEYAKRCLQIAAENADLEGDEGDSLWIDKKSITDITLPKHD